MSRLARAVSLIRWSAMLAQNIASAVIATAAQIEGELAVRHPVDPRAERMESATSPPTDGWIPGRDFDDHPQVGFPDDQMPDEND